MRLWIKDPLAILAPDAERGIVVEGSRIVECVPHGGAPAAAMPEILARQVRYRVNCFFSSGLAG